VKRRRRLSIALFVASTLSADHPARAEPGQSDNGLVASCAANRKKKKSSPVDKYGGHCGSDGFYYDRFGGHYEDCGYEYKDGSFTSRTGAHYDAKSNKILERDGSEREVPPDLRSPKDRKAIVRVDCYLAVRDHRQKGDVQRAFDGAAEPPESTDAPEPSETSDEAHVLRPIQLAAGDSRPRDEAGAQQSLRALSAFLAQRRDITKLRIEGHTNNSRTDKSSLALSRRRALAVKEALIKLGVENERLEAVAIGSAMPIADNATAAGRARNDRVEFRIAEINGAPWADPGHPQAQPQ